MTIELGENRYGKSAIRVVRIVRGLVDFTLPVVRDRGFEYAEVTAGGVPLDEVNVATISISLRAVTMSSV